MSKYNANKSGIRCELKSKELLVNHFTAEFINVKQVKRASNRSNNINPPRTKEELTIETLKRVEENNIFVKIKWKECMENNKVLIVKDLSFFDKQTGSCVNIDMSILLPNGKWIVSEIKNQDINGSVEHKFKWFATNLRDGIYQSENFPCPEFGVLFNCGVVDHSLKFEMLNTTFNPYNCYFVYNCMDKLIKLIEREL